MSPLWNVFTVPGWNQNMSNVKMNKKMLNKLSKDNKRRSWIYNEDTVEWNITMNDSNSEPLMTANY